jgi:hypothetical protein
MDDDKKPKNRLQEIIEAYLGALEKRTLSKRGFEPDERGAQSHYGFHLEACPHARPFYSRDGKRVLFVVK